MPPIRHITTQLYNNRPQQAREISPVSLVNVGISAKNRNLPLFLNGTVLPGTDTVSLPEGPVEAENDRLSHQLPICRVILSDRRESKDPLFWVRILRLRHFVAALRMTCFLGYITYKRLFTAVTNRAGERCERCRGQRKRVERVAAVGKKRACFVRRCFCRAPQQVREVTTSTALCTNCQRALPA